MVVFQFFGNLVDSCAARNSGRCIIATTLPPKFINRQIVATRSYTYIHISYKSRLDGASLMFRHLMSHVTYSCLLFFNHEKIYQIHLIFFTQFFLMFYLERLKNISRDNKAYQTFLSALYISANIIGVEDLNKIIASRWLQKDITASFTNKNLCVFNCVGYPRILFRIWRIKHVLDKTRLAWFAYFEQKCVSHLLSKSSIFDISFSTVDIFPYHFEQKNSD